MDYACILVIDMFVIAYNDGDGAGLLPEWRVCMAISDDVHRRYDLTGGVNPATLAKFMTSVVRAVAAHTRSATRDTNDDVAAVASGRGSSASNRDPGYVSDDSDSDREWLASEQLAPPCMNENALADLDADDSKPAKFGLHGLGHALVQPLVNTSKMLPGSAAMSLDRIVGKARHKRRAVSCSQIQMEQSVHLRERS